VLALRRCVLLGVSLFAVLFLVCGVALAAKSYPDPVGDVKGGPGPDIASVKVSNTKTKVTFGVRFAKAPPLRVSKSGGWIEIDVPPLGPRPIPGSEWLGANFALGTHGPSQTGLMVRLGQGIPAESRQVARFKIVTSGSTLTWAHGSTCISPVSPSRPA